MVDPQKIGRPWQARFLAELMPFVGIATGAYLGLVSTAKDAADSHCGTGQLVATFAGAVVGLLLGVAVRIPVLELVTWLKRPPDAP